MQCFRHFLLHLLPSSLRKPWKRLLFTPNISTGDEGVHRHQAIVPFLLYDTATNHRAFNFTSLNNAILTLPHLSVHALCQFFAHNGHAVCCQSPISAFTASTATLFHRFLLRYLLFSLESSIYCVYCVCFTMNFTAERLFLILLPNSCLLSIIFTTSIRELTWIFQVCVAPFFFE